MIHKHGQNDWFLTFIVFIYENNTVQIPRQSRRGWSDIQWKTQRKNMNFFSQHPCQTFTHSQTHKDKTLRYREPGRETSKVIVTTQVWILPISSRIYRYTCVCVHFFSHLWFPVLMTVNQHGTSIIWTQQKHKSGPKVAYKSNRIKTLNISPLTSSSTDSNVGLTLTSSSETVKDTIDTKQ